MKPEWNKASRPFLRMAVRAVDVADDQRLQNALAEIAGQHRSVTIRPDPQGGLYSLEGTAESDLDLICDRLRDDYHIAINVAPPQAILIETIRKEAEAEGKYIRQTGGSGNYGHCKLRIEPVKQGARNEFVNDIQSSVVPNEFIKAIEEGVHSAMASGILAGLPLRDIRVTLFDGSYHESDSNEMAFRFAGSIALKEAVKRASPVVLEPMMSIEMDVFENLVPAIRNKLVAHRGRIEREELIATGLTEIKAVVPLSELLASTSGAFDDVPMEFAGYEPVRDNRSSDDGAAGVTANKPNRPRLGSRSAQRAPEES